ncbi:MAG: DUF4280 domain-containing protein [Proteobacteria bacterium]|nr:DUF4280 domain-containing protein [Pseudomonadota bacterium]
MACSQGALCKCIFGAAPVPLNAAVPPTLAMGVSGPLASIKHNVPILNIPPMGTCVSPKQPTMKVGIPGPCIPAVSAPWLPGAVTTMTSSGPLLNNLSIGICQSMNGVITIIMPGSPTIITTP